LDGCDNLVWDDELDEVEAANPKSSRSATHCKNCERMKEFGREFGMELGREIGRELGKEIGKKFSQFVIGVMMVCVVLFAMILKSI
jgi:ribosomal protein S14